MSFVEQRWSSCLHPTAQDGFAPVIGVIDGEGIGPEVIHAALRVLATVETALDLRFEIIRYDGLIGTAAEASSGQALPGGVVDFCEEIFAARGAVLCGPGGGRFVYDLRRHFDLFCKLSPVTPWPELRNAARLKPEALREVDALFVRENVAGVYQGDWRTENSSGRRAIHSFSYSEHEVRRLLLVAADIAARRRGKVTVIHKAGGVPAVSDLWAAVSREVALETGVLHELVNADYAAYLIVQDPVQLDVVATPNLFGDILIDLSAILLGSRGLAFSGNYNGQGSAVYQTNHGAAYDLAGTGRANPAGQLLSLAMLLSESFGLTAAARLIVDGLRQVWAGGWRTADLMEPGCSLVDAGDMTSRVTDAMMQLAGNPVEQ
jgi:3-isopropylmalate dehydrogenase